MKSRIVPQQFKIKLLSSSEITIILKKEWKFIFVFQIYVRWKLRKTCKVIRNLKARTSDNVKYACVVNFN